MVNILYQQPLPMGQFLVFSERPPFPIASLQQVHSNIVVDLRNTNSIAAVSADGMIAGLDHSLPLGIVTADCLPIAISGPQAVAMIHAGWRGLWQEILAAPALMAIRPHYFFLGPHIRPCCYQVGEEFLQYFPQHLTLQGPWFLDLAQVAKAQLRRWYPHAQIEQADQCTSCHSSGFHSYRRTKNDCRNWNLLLPSHQKMHEGFCQ